MSTLVTNVTVITSVTVVTAVPIVTLVIPVSSQFCPYSVLH